MYDTYTILSEAFLVDGLKEKTGSKSHRYYPQDMTKFEIAVKMMEEFILKT